MSTPTYEVPKGWVCLDCNGSMLAALCGRTDAGSDGPCVMRSGHGDSPCWGEGDVASDWEPALPCRVCCVCPCGSTMDGSLCRFCGVRMRPGTQPPKFNPGTHRPEGTET